MSLGTLATTAIITKGLTCTGPVCNVGLITTHFSLFCKEVVKPIKSGGGGLYPHDAWNKFGPGEIQKFYTPTPEQYYVVPRDKEAEYFRRHKIISMQIKIGDKTIEKEWSVPETRGKQIINVAKFANTTLERINIITSNIKKRTSDAIVKIKHFKLRK